VTRAPSRPRRVAAGRARRALGALVAGASLAAAAGCAIPTDDEPRALPADAVPEEARQRDTTSTSPPSTSTQLEQLYLVRTGETGQAGGERLQPLPVPIATPADPDDLPRAVVEALIELDPIATGQTGLVNSVPTETEVLSAQLGADGVLDLELANLEDVESAQLRLAVAQIVFSATGITALPVRGVRFTIDGQPAAVPTETGTSGTGEIITRASFPRLDELARTAEDGAGSG
jgi:spore germination protein GerM